MAFPSFRIPGSKARDISENYVGVNLPYVMKLMKSEPQNVLDLYRFSANYFGDKLEEREAITVGIKSLKGQNTEQIVSKNHETESKRHSGRLSYENEFMKVSNEGSSFKNHLPMEKEIKLLENFKSVVTEARNKEHERNISKTNTETKNKGDSESIPDECDFIYDSFVKVHPEDINYPHNEKVKMNYKSDFLEENKGTKKSASPEVESLNNPNIHQNINKIPGTKDKYNYERMPHEISETENKCESESIPDVCDFIYDSFVEIHPEETKFSDEKNIKTNYTNNFPLENVNIQKAVNSALTENVQFLKTAIDTLQLDFANIVQDMIYTEMSTEKTVDVPILDKKSATVDRIAKKIKETSVQIARATDCKTDITFENIKKSDKICQSDNIKRSDKLCQTDKIKRVDKTCQSDQFKRSDKICQSNEVKESDKICQSDKIKGSDKICQSDKIKGSDKICQCNSSKLVQREKLEVMSCEKCKTLKCAECIQKSDTGYIPDVVKSAKNMVNSIKCSLSWNERKHKTCSAKDYKSPTTSPDDSDSKQSTASESKNNGFTKSTEIIKNISELDTTDVKYQTKLLEDLKNLIRLLDVGPTESDLQKMAKVFSERTVSKIKILTQNDSGSEEENESSSSQPSSIEAQISRTGKYVPKSENNNLDRIKKHQDTERNEFLIRASSPDKTFNANDEFHKAMNESLLREFSPDRNLILKEVFSIGSLSSNKEPLCKAKIKERSVSTNAHHNKMNKDSDSRTTYDKALIGLKQPEIETEKDAVTGDKDSSKFRIDLKYDDKSKPNLKNNWALVFEEYF